PSTIVHWHPPAAVSMHDRWATGDRGAESAERPRSQPWSERVRGRLPLLEALRDELYALLFASAVQHQEVCGIGSTVDARGAGIRRRVAIRPCRAVPRGGGGGLHHGPAVALELRGIRVPGAVEVPGIGDAAGIAE